MSKYIISGDLHIGLSLEHDADIEKGFEEINIVCGEQEADLILAGDIFHIPRPTPDRYKFFGDCLSILANPTNIYIIDGNHDKTGSGRSTLETFQSNYFFREDVKIYTEFTRVRVKDEIDLLFCPFEQEDYADKITKFSAMSEAETKILIAHLDIPGAISGAEREIQLGNVDSLPSVNNLFDLVVSGHIHKQQVFDYGKVECVYPGALSRVSHSEEKEKKGFVLFNTEGFSLRFIPRKTDRKYYTLDYKWNGKEFKLPENFKSKKGVFRVNIKADAKHIKTIDRKAIMKTLSKQFEEVRINVIYDRKTSEEAESVASGSSFEDYENRWIDENAKGSKTVVKKKFREVMKQVEVDEISHTQYAGLYLEEINIENFQSIEKAEKKFRSGDCIGILGQIDGDFSQSNGSGKSSFLEAIRFCLYGETRFSKISSVIRDGSDSCNVNLLFKDSKNNKISIEREVRDTGSKANVLVNMVQEAKGSREVTKWIIENFGINKTTFDAVVYCGADRHSIIGAKATDRLKALQEPLPLDKYKNGLKIVKEEKSSLRSQKDAIQGVLDEFDDASEEDLKALKNEEADLSKKVGKMKTEKNEIKDTLKKWQKVADIKFKIESFESNLELEQDEEKLLKQFVKNNTISKDKMPSLKKKVEDLNKKIIEKENIIEKERLVYSDHKVKLDQAKQDLENLEKQRVGVCTVCGEKCTICKDKLTEEKRKKLKAEKRLWVQEFQRKLDQSGKRGHVLTSEKTKHVQSLEKFKEEISDCKECDRRKVEYQSKVKKYEKSINDIVKKIDSLKEKIKDEKFSQKDFESKELKEEALEKGIDRLLEIISTKKQDTAVLEKDLSRYKEAKKKAEIINKEITTCNIIYDALSPKGIPQAICMALIEEINNVLPVVISNMGFWQDINIWFEPDDRKATSSITVWVQIGDKEPREFEGLSQGEREISNLLFREAYRAVLQNLIDLNYNFIMIDEALDTLDERNLAVAIQYYRQAKLQSFCISHSNLRDAFSKTIIVRNENGVAEVV